jgi:nicotinate-nucleotide adenylyltransferase
MSVAATARYVAEGGSTRHRIGVFGSAFNPPQLAHLKLVEDARRQLGLDLVLIVPTGDAYHKDQESDPGPEVRFRLAEAAFADADGVTVCRLEVDREGPSYTYATLEQIADENPESEIYLLMGADTAGGFAGWRRPGRVLELARIAVAPRPGTDEAEVKAAFDSLGADRLEFLSGRPVEASSSEVRRRIAAGTPFEGLVPRAVAEMINNEGVYGSEL